MVGFEENVWKALRAAVGLVPVSVLVMVVLVVLVVLAHAIQVYAMEARTSAVNEIMALSRRARGFGLSPILEADFLAGLIRLNSVLLFHQERGSQVYLRAWVRMARRMDSRRKKRPSLLFVGFPRRYAHARA